MKPQMSDFGLQRSLGMLFDRERPWRRKFFLLRVANVLNKKFVPSLKPTSLSRNFELMLKQYPEAIVPYLNYIHQSQNNTSALVIVDRISSHSQVTAAELVEVAKYYYSKNKYAEGDALLEQAKSLEPTLLRIYDEEAWNQRHRGNLHREIQALEHCVNLAPSTEETIFWRGWLGDALTRQGKLEEAWEQLKDFYTLPVGNPILLTVAYCARKMNKLSKLEAAYHLFAPTKLGGFNLRRVATAQFDVFRRTDETLNLLEFVDEHSETKLLELSYSAQLKAGNAERALSYLRILVERSDRPAWAKETLGQFLEICDLPEEALKVYSDLVPSEGSKQLRYRRGLLLVASNKTQLAVEQYLDGCKKLGKLHKKLLLLEVDIQLPLLFEHYREAPNLSTEIESLEKIYSRSSSLALLTRAAESLALRFAQQERWSDAWEIIAKAQLVKLPFISVHKRPQNSKEVNLSAKQQFAEVTETEAIRQNIVLYESSLGDTTSCNPLAICLHLLQDPQHSNLQHVWSVQAGTTIHPELLKRSNVSFVRKGSPGYLRYLATAGTLINNSTFETYFIKRKGQRYLNTWHGVPWKTLGRDNRSEPFAYGNIARNFLQADLVLAPDAHTFDVLTRSMDIDAISSAKFLQVGYPRNDLSINLSSAKRLSIRAELGVKANKKLVLFMPTWKGSFDNRVNEVEKSITIAQGLTAPGHIIALRAHHYVREHLYNDSATQEFVLIPEHMDTNELIGAADALVTDFSSVLFDASVVRVPVVKFIAEMKKYSEDRGLYFTPEEVPGANAKTISEAQRYIQLALNAPNYFIEKYEKETARFSNTENGHSTEDVCKWLFNSPHRTPQIKQNERPPTLLLSTGALPPNGITRALRSLLVALDTSSSIPYLFPSANAIASASPETIDDIRTYSRILPHVGAPAGTRMEDEVLRYFSSSSYTNFPFVGQFLISGRKREAQRLFGDIEFDSAVEYSAYDSRNIALLSYGISVSTGKRGIIFHNEMWKEIENRFPRLQSGMNTLQGFDFYGSVSSGVRDYNAETMFQHFHTPREKHITTENMINVAEIVAASDMPLDQSDRDWYSTPGKHACVVARLSPEKNHSALLLALVEVQTTLTQPIKLTFLGDGPLRFDLEQQVRDLDLSDLVRVRGLVPNPPAHLKAVDAMILPSLHEGQPLVILESLTVGTPVVATDTPGSRSVLQEGKLGVLVAITHQGLSEALHRVAEDDLTDTAHFDADVFTEQSLSMFIDAISAS